MIGNVALFLVFVSGFLLSSIIYEVFGANLIFSSKIAPKSSSYYSLPCRKPTDQLVTKDAVIVRATEWLGWLHRERYSFNQIFVYDMLGSTNYTGGISRMNKVTRKSLPNVGREAAGFLQHIVDHYEELADITVFMHGWPVDHLDAEKDRFFDMVRCLRNDVEFLALNRPNLFRFEKIESYDQKNGGWQIFRRFLDKHGYDSFPVPFSMNEKGERKYLPVQFYCCAQFAVSRARIRAHSKQFWSDLLELSRTLVPRDPSPDWLAYILEMYWHVLFAYDPDWVRAHPAEALIQPSQHSDSEICKYLKPGCSHCSWENYLSRATPEASLRSAVGVDDDEALRLVARRVVQGRMLHGGARTNDRDFWKEFNWLAQQTPADWHYDPTGESVAVQEVAEGHFNQERWDRDGGWS